MISIIYHRYIIGDVLHAHSTLVGTLILPSNKHFKNNYIFCEHGMQSHLLFNMVKKIYEGKFYPKFFIEHC